MKINWMQKFLLGLIVISVIIYGSAILAPRKNGNQRNNVPTSTVSPITTSAIPTPTNTAADAESLRLAVLNKSQIAEKDFLYAVGINDGTLARGTVSSKNDVNGAAWFAAKVNGNWVVSYIGQGVPNCFEIAGINYPTTWISHCMEGNKTIKR